ncbi:STAS domain-containing protein [Floridanema evergladense]|uniref:STAS domain-containing protein n=1 Tax=Floridaenema evergladense BLCC-F167 TaxID=3153639 RepID=A0ABV4WUA7_9CYAN
MPDDSTSTELLQEIAQLRQRIAELEGAASIHLQTEREMEESRDYLQNIIDTVREPLVILDGSLQVISAGRSFYELFQVTAEETLGRQIYELGNRQWDIPILRQLLEDILSSNSSFDDFEVEHEFESLGLRSLLLNARKVYRPANQSQLILLAMEDVTEKKRAQERLTRQSQELLEISTPILQIMAGVVVAPLIGTLDSQRAQRFTEVLLDRVVETRSDIALVDITGVPTVDTQTAHHLIESISAVKLLGAQVILTGVSPAIAQTVVQLGIDLSDILTRSSLVAGLRVAMNLLNLKIVQQDKGV